MCFFKKKDRKPKRVRVYLSDPKKKETKKQRLRRERALRELDKG